MNRKKKVAAMATVLAALTISCTATESDIIINGETITSSMINSMEEELEKQEEEFLEGLENAEIELFDPEIHDDGYQPPPSESYDPLPPNYQPPPMPDFPDKMPEMTEDGYNPFAPQTKED